MAEGKTAAAQLAAAATAAAGRRYVLRLFVAGMTSRSRRAIENIRAICEARLPGRYDLLVIDVFQQPDLAREEQIIAAPTLVKKAPPPMRHLVGDMSDAERVLAGLDLAPAG